MYSRSTKIVTPLGENIDIKTAFRDSWEREQKPSDASYMAWSQRAAEISRPDLYLATIIPGSLMHGSGDPTQYHHHRGKTLIFRCQQLFSIVLGLKSQEAYQHQQQHLTAFWQLLTCPQACAELHGSLVIVVPSRSIFWLALVLWHPGESPVNIP